MSTRSNVIAHTLGSHGPVPADRLKGMAVMAMNTLLCVALAAYYALRLVKLQHTTAPMLFHTETVEVVTTALGWSAVAAAMSLLPGVGMLLGRPRVAAITAISLPLLALVGLGAGHTALLLPGGLGIATAIFLFRTRVEG